MSTFSYSGFGADGQSETGELDAASEAMAYELLQAKGITVFNLSASGEAGEVDVLPWYRRDISFGGKTIPLQEQAAIAGLLSTLFSAGLTVPEILRIVGLSSERKLVRRQFEKTGQRVADGNTLAEAFRAENICFSPLFASFLALADTANSTAPMMKSLSSHLAEQDRIRQKVLSALVYPAILVLAALGLLFVVVFYLAPNLEPLFSAMGRAPPPTLSGLLAIGAFLTKYGVLALTIGLLSFGALVAGLQNPAGKAKFIALNARLPLIGPLLRASTLSQLAQSVGLLLQAGLPLSEACRQSVASGDFAKLFHGTFEQAAEAVEQGQQASSVLRHDPMIPMTFSELFFIGEETNSLPASLKAASETLTAEVEHKSQRLLTLLTPSITMVLGLGVGFLIYTLMGAILEVNEIAF